MCPVINLKHVAGGKLRVYAFAPSAQASRKVLRTEGFNDADTLKALLVNERLQAAARLGNKKLVRDGASPDQLFDLSADIEIA